ncbi:MAG: glucokinase [Candidatus Sericytochromatia bacterium]|nr:glucokinase [Candidatus Sericytochromatia bacterium]
MGTLNLLAADIGGTKVALALFEWTPGGPWRVMAEARYVSADHPTFTEILKDFRLHHPQPVQATGLGIAGPVFERRCQATNLPWVVDARELEASLPLGRVALINDFKAAALGVLHMKEPDWVELNPGVPEPRAPIAVLGAGTGLGEALLFHDGHRYQVVSTEGGHKDFAPRNEEEMGLLRFMLKRHARVSYERLLSGAGIRAIYDHLIEAGAGPARVDLQRRFEAEDDAALIAGHAAAGDDPVCIQAMEMFTRIYGAEAGNLALQVLARGGVYIAGGIGPKNLARMQDGQFQTAYRHKGRFSDLVASIPVRMVINPYVALVGAAAAAAELEAQSG